MYGGDAAEVDIGDDAQHQIVHLVKAVLPERQVAAPAEIVHRRAVDGGEKLACVLFHGDLLGIVDGRSIPHFAGGHNGENADAVKITTIPRQILCTYTS